MNEEKDFLISSSKNKDSSGNFVSLRKIEYRIDMTPEEKARQKIDRWFADAGWKVVNRDEYEPTCTAVAIREGLLKGNLEADYFLFINVPLPKFYTFKSREERERILYRNFVNVGMEVKEMIKDVLNKRKAK
ncbi:hypothetical protein HMPREF9442_00708 [Paraprevotella xylaniphila YIT 11841]|uniref:Uncharacterized protein n=2 Tax=Paraprevotella xylaniphila TaxID=454155 RepID=F3QRA9_9BACT|nr:hypothetical protein HMPREF9442_00708 [Paraprevotella xylaniphila YIT 11841]